MPDRQRFHLTTKDYTILEVMLERFQGRDPVLVDLLTRKIAGAKVVFRADIAPDVATLSSRAVYRVDHGPQETRIIAHDEMRGLVGTVIPITNPRGLALLGLAEGDSMSFKGSGGEVETVTLLKVAYQPEAARSELRPAFPGLPARPPALRLVHSRDEGPPRQSLPGEEPDDPGPSAA